MTRPALPESGDPWHWVEWMLECERDLYVRVERLNAKTNSKQMTLVPMLQLSPAEWVFWTKRLFFDKTTTIMPYEDWRKYEERKGWEPATVSPYDVPF